MINQIQNTNRKKKKRLGWDVEEGTASSAGREGEGGGPRFPFLPTYLLLDLEAGFSLEESSHTKVEAGALQ